MQPAAAAASLRANARTHTLQRKGMLLGLDERQLKMLKAEVMLATLLGC